MPKGAGIETSTEAAQVQPVAHGSAVNDTGIPVCPGYRIALDLDEGFAFDCSVTPPRLQQAEQTPHAQQQAPPGFQVFSADG